MISAAEAVNVQTHLDVTVRQLSFVQIFHCEAHLNKPVRTAAVSSQPVCGRHLVNFAASECDQSACRQVSLGFDRGDADFEVARVAVL